MLSRFAAITPQRFTAVSSAALWLLIAIVITGASVRLTGSGLGCSDWPACEPGELVPATEFHAWVEFGNRLVTGLVALVVIAAVSGSLLRVPRRRDLVWWSVALVVGVLAQVILGAVTVLSHLSPPIVMAHFLLSSLLVAAATNLAWRARQPDARPARLAEADGMGSVGSPPQDAQQPGSAQQDKRLVLMRSSCWVISVVLAVALFTGTLVTATGPHGGDEDVERLNLVLGDVARVHGITVVVSLALLVWLLVWLARQAHAHTSLPATEPASQPTRTSLPHLAQVLKRAEILLVVLAVQGVIGYVQYFNQLPVLLVGLHVTGATLAVVALVRLVLTANERTTSRTAQHTTEHTTGSTASRTARHPNK